MAIDCNKCTCLERENERDNSTKCDISRVCLYKKCKNIQLVAPFYQKKKPRHDTRYKQDENNKKKMNLRGFIV